MKSITPRNKMRFIVTLFIALALVMIVQGQVLRPPICTAPATGTVCSLVPTTKNTCPIGNILLNCPAPNVANPCCGPKSYTILKPV